MAHWGACAVLSPEGAYRKSFPALLGTGAGLWFSNPIAGANGKNAACFPVPRKIRFFCGVPRIAASKESLAKMKGRKMGY